MRIYKLTLLLIIIFFSIGFSAAYTGSSTTDRNGGSNGGSIGGGILPGEQCGDGIDNDGDGQVDEGCTSNTPNDPGSCYNSADDDDDGQLNLNDRGCVGPEGVDEIEGNIWDTDLTTTMSGENPNLNEDQSVYFNGSIVTGNDYNLYKENDTAGGGTAVEGYITDMGSEEGTTYTYANNQFYAYGRNSQTTHNGFPADSDFLNGRLIDGPNNYDGGDCGDGFEDETYSGSAGNESGTNTNTVTCKRDLGDILTKKDIKQPHEDSNLPCENDKASCDNDAESSCSPDKNYPGCGSTCKTKTAADCSLDTDNSDQEDHYEFRINGDSIEKKTCDNGGTCKEKSSSNCIATDSDSCSANTYTSYCSNENETSGECLAYACKDSGNDCSDSTWDGDGEYRSWSSWSDVVNCHDSYSINHGGGDTSGNGASSADNGANKPDNDPAGTYTRFTAHEDSSWGTTTFSNSDDTGSGSVWCGYDYTTTVDADGPRGNGDGFVVIHQGSISGTESPNGEDNVGTRVMVNGDTNNFRDYRNLIDTSCPGDKTTCLKYADYITNAGTGTYGSPEWDTVSEAVELNTDTYTPNQSYSVCKNINRINEKNGNGQDELIDCDYENNRDNAYTYSNNHDVSPLPEACGDEPDEHLIQFEGPEVNENTVQNNGRGENGQINSDLAYAQKCVNWGEDVGGFGNGLSADACVRNGTAYREGTVINVARLDANGYEQGGDSPDWEVCADIPGEGDDVPWDNGEDNAGTDYGGEWYDLDSELVQDYIGQNTANALGGSPSNPHRLAYYWRENPNPQHSNYNPEGREYGTAIEDDCGPNVEGCNDENTQSSKNPSFFNFIGNVEGIKDEDYHPQGESSQGDAYEPYSYFDPHGQLNKLQEDSNQLESSMDTTFKRSIDIWEDSVAGTNEADMYALTEKLSWSISNRGVPYAPLSAPYHEDYSGSKRSGPSSDTVAKEDKVFGNSLAVVAAQDFISSNGNTIKKGQGYWIDPDDIRSEENNYNGNWRSVINYKNDITGPDAGLGFDVPSLPLGNPNFQDSGDIALADIFFQDENAGGNEYLEKPMCGDDQREYFLEERGESVNSKKYVGRYACADAQDHCVQRDYTQKLHDTGTYLQANEDSEDRGRLKQDVEICEEVPNSRFAGYDGDDFPNWYDQDFGDIDGDGVQDTCRTNNLYGALGKRWFSEEDVEEHPNAFTGGIDDDSNEKLEDAGLSNLESRPGQSSWTSSQTPVSSGELNDPNPDRNVTTKGFCGGDDKSEYIVTQRCKTRFCETDNSVIGVSEDPNRCILDQDLVDGVSGTKRDLYDQGETVNVDTGSDTKTIACYGGEWHEDWPVVFLRESTEVPIGTTDRVSFQVINVQDDSGTFDLDLSIADDNLDALTTFQETGTNEMTVEVPGSASRTYNVEIKGNRLVDPAKEIELQGESRDGNLEGFDTLQASITNSTSMTVGNTTQQRRDVPGIGLVQIIWLFTMASAIYLFTGRKL